MVREVNKLTAQSVKKQTKPGRHSDGGGLYLLVQPNGNRSWVFRWRDRTTSKLRDKGLGPAWDISLQEARDAAKTCRAIVRAGGDPIQNALAARIALKVDDAKRVTFRDCATRYIEAHKAGWRNEKHAAQWDATLTTYCAPLMPLPVDAIDTGLVVSCLEPHWATKTETMTRVRGRIESVLAWATARKYRAGDNPARWRGHLDQLLPKRSKVQKVVHRPALAAADMYDFMRTLRGRSTVAARALELQILTASRPGEAAAAQWDEFDFAANVWTIPAERMKAARDHRVPLSLSTLKLLKVLPRIKGESNVFPGVKGRPITTAAGMALLKDLRPGVTAHGFRSTFRDWAGDSTTHPREVVEAALAHVVKDKVEAAYRRGDALERRARLMVDWSTFIDAAPGTATITPIRGAKRAPTRSGAGR